MVEQPIYFLHAFAVSPDHGSEKGLGFLWLKELAEKCHVVCFSEREFVAAAQVALGPDLEGKVRFESIDIGDKARKIIWNQGQWSAYFFLWWYHVKVLIRALKVAKECKPAVVHHLNLIGFRSPGFLFLLKPLFGARLIWGPIGGTNLPPPRIYAKYGLRVGAKQLLKNFFSLTTLLWPSVILWRFFSDKIFWANASGSRIFKWYFGDPALFPETFSKPQFYSVYEVRYEKKIRVLSVGKNDSRKLHLAVRDAIFAYARSVPSDDIEVIMIGYNDFDLRELLDKSEAQSLSNVTFTSKLVSNSEMKSCLSEGDVLIHSSIDEGTSHAVVEALCTGIPIIMFDVGGHLEYVSDTDQSVFLMQKPASFSEGVSAIMASIEDFREWQGKKHGLVIDRTMERFSPQMRVTKFLEICDV